MAIRCNKCRALTKCSDAVKNRHVIRCPFFEELSKHISEVPPESVITCRNCAFHHDTLEGSGGFHIHDYCSVWMTQIPNHVIFDRLELESGHDDIECGLARCWAFRSKPNNIQTEFPRMI